MRTGWLVTVVVCALVLSGCGSPQASVAPPHVTLSDTMRQVASQAQHEGVTFVGATTSTVDPIAPTPVLHFTTRSLDAWGIAEAATVVAVEVGKTERSEFRGGFDLMVTGEGGTGGVRLSFDATTVAHTDWAKLEEEFSSVSFPVVFERATSYEWQSGSDWINTTDPVVGDPDDRLPPGETFPRARFDELAIRRIASEVEYSDGDEEEEWSISTTVTTTGEPSLRRVTVSVDSSASLAYTASDVVARQGSYILRRLSKDPTIATVDLVVSVRGDEICILSFRHRALAAIDWASLRVYGPRAALVLFRTARAYRWTDSRQWRDDLRENGLKASELPRVKSDVRLP